MYAVLSVLCLSIGGASWVLMTSAAGWSARYAHAALIDSMDNLYVLGGYDPSYGYMNDVWKSSGTTILYHKDYVADMKYVYFD